MRKAGTRRLGEAEYLEQRDAEREKEVEGLQLDGRGAREGEATVLKTETGAQLLVNERARRPPPQTVIPLTSQHTAHIHTYMHTHVDYAYTISAVGICTHTHAACTPHTTCTYTFMLM